MNTGKIMNIIGRILFAEVGNLVLIQRRETLPSFAEHAPEAERSAPRGYL